MKKDYTAVLLEDVNSKMQVIVEVLHSVKEKETPLLNKWE